LIFFIFEFFDFYDFLEYCVYYLADLALAFFVGAPSPLDLGGYHWEDHIPFLIHEPGAIHLVIPIGVFEFFVTFVNEVGVIVGFRWFPVADFAPTLTVFLNRYDLERVFWSGEVEVVEVVVGAAHDPTLAGAFKGHVRHISVGNC